MTVKYGITYEGPNGTVKELDSVEEYYKNDDMVEIYYYPDADEFSTDDTTFQLKTKNIIVPLGRVIEIEVY